jgi:hypothetical protein
VSQVLFWRRSAAHEAKSPDRPKLLPGQQSRLRYPPAISCRNFRILPTNSLFGLKQGISSPENGNTLPKNDYPPAILFLVSALCYFYNNISQHFVNFRLILQRTQGASFSGCEILGPRRMQGRNHSAFSCLHAIWPDRIRRSDLIHKRPCCLSVFIPDYQLSEDEQRNETIGAISCRWCSAAADMRCPANECHFGESAS